MTKAVIQDAIYCFNALPSYNGVSYTLSLVAIVQRLPNPNYDNITFDFG